jgi:hypothetical protein
LPCGLTRSFLFVRGRRDTCPAILERSIASKRIGGQFNENPFDICFNRMPPMKIRVNGLFTALLHGGARSPGIGISAWFAAIYRFAAFMRG